MIGCWRFLRKNEILMTKWWIFISELNIADFGYVLVGGENKYEGHGQELLNDQDVRKSFLGG